MRWILVAAAMLAGPATAEPVDGKAAGKMLFSSKGFEILVRNDSGLSEIDLKTVAVLVTMDSFTASAAYYGAIAYAPGDGLASEATIMSSKLHTPEAAGAAALKACNAKKKSAADCQIIADVLPAKWSRQPLMLNVDATEGLKTYRKGRGPKAMAISPATGVWSIAKGPGADRAALNDCLAKAQPLGATDCAVVIADN
jgi:hypothetical protein